MNVHQYLVNWAIRFLENKDIVHRKIVAVKKQVEGYDFGVEYKDKSKVFTVRPMLDEGLLKGLNGKDVVGVFTLNNDDNLTFLVKHWDTLKKNKLLTIFFINPFSQVDKSWIVMPFVHDRVCDIDSLKTGLHAMSSMVDPISEEVLEENITAETE